jgi:hypothetical protein
VKENHVKLDIDISPRALKAAVVAVLAGALLVACTSSGPDPNSAQGKAKAQREDVSAAQEAAVPYPAAELKNPLDRKQLADRLRRNNNPNAISYLYILSNTGTPIGYFVLKGKLTSTESSLLPTDMIIDACNKGGEYCPEVVQGGGDDGTYGSNENAVFGFTAQGVMITIRAENWFQSDAPIALNVPDLTPKK